jgi:hypothetical protein
MKMTDLDTRVIEFCRRNVVPLLLTILIVLQFMTVLAVFSMRGIVDTYSCGTSLFPCYVKIDR